MPDEAPKGPQAEWEEYENRVRADRDKINQEVVGIFTASPPAPQSDFGFPPANPVTPRPRPTYHDDAVLDAAVVKLLPHVIQWHGKDFHESERERIIVALRKNIGFFVDGYDFAKSLERSWLWECNADLVEILDDATMYVGDAYNQAVREWVAEQLLRPQIQIGTGVKFKHTGKEYDGKVAGYRSDEGVYVIEVPELARQQSSPGSTVLAYHVPYERLEADNPERLDPDVAPAPIQEEPTRE